MVHTCEWSRRSAGSLARPRHVESDDASNDAGAVTVEAALVVAVLAVVAVALMWMVGLGVTAAALGDIARDAARAIGRGESAAHILDRDGISAQVRSDGQQVTVIVTREVPAPLLGTTVTIEQHATALAEPGLS